jgi:hypothetical protein
MATKSGHKVDAALAGKTRYLIERSGRFHARIVVPKRLQPLIHKTELSRPLGSDRRLALRALPRAAAATSSDVAQMSKCASVNFAFNFVRSTASDNRSYRSHLGPTSALSPEPAPRRAASHCPLALARFRMQPARFSIGIGVANKCVRLNSGELVEHPLSPDKRLFG